MTNNTINLIPFRHTDRITSISNSEYNHSKSNAQNYFKQKKVINISPALLGYKLGDKFTANVQKRLSKNKYLIKVNSDIFELSSELHLDIGSSIYFEIISLMEDSINANVLNINKNKNFLGKNIKLKFIEKKSNLKLNHTNNLVLSKNSTYFINFLNLILINEKNIFSDHIINKLPSFDNKDPSKIIYLITNILNSKIQDWLGSNVVELLKRNKKINFQEEINKLNKLKKNGDWFYLIIPFFENDNLKIIHFNFYLTDEKVRRLRFKIEFELNNGKEIIIEGLFGLGKIILKISSSEILSKDLESDIKKLFYKNLKKYYFSGTIHFQKIINTSNSINLYRPNKQGLKYKIMI